ncbi:hypothetical protein N0V90_012337 [Kalmusia sp. IMI 367209]|nr:hypothetical protein N0V90_012337 [Kalmusia sp. IMI 367209]
MAAPRLPFLWPMLFKPLKTPRTCAPAATRRTTVRPLTATSHPRKESISQRYGTAQEPAAHLRGEKQLKTSDEESKSLPELIEEEEEEEPPTSTIPPSQTKNAEAETPGQAPPEPPPDPPKVPDAKPLDTILHMPSPQEEEQRKPPHLKTPPYVHHFDTYSLVKGPYCLGFYAGPIGHNNEGGLISKSHVENETYLFRAACSELRTEVGNTRKAEIERMRSERNQLQHEVDILSQRMSQETSHLKDELKGLFDDRKMAVRNEQRHMESLIQRLGYKITIELNSDARSEVEGLRWILTRRAATAIGISAFLIFTALRYFSSVSHQEQKKKEEEERDTSPDAGDNSPSTGKPALGKDEPLGGELLTTEGGVALA